MNLEARDKNDIVDKLNSKKDSILNLVSNDSNYDNLRKFLRHNFQFCPKGNKVVLEESEKVRIQNIIDSL